MLLLSRQPKELSVGGVLLQTRYTKTTYILDQMVAYIMGHIGNSIRMVQANWLMVILNG